MIEPEMRKSFEQSGIETIRLLTYVGNFDGGDRVRAQALEWISEQAELQAANQKKRATEQTSMRRWTTVGASAAIVAAIASIVTIFQGF